jgi:hypothetical protein
VSYGWRKWSNSHARSTATETTGRPRSGRHAARHASPRTASSAGPPCPHLLVRHRLVVVVIVACDERHGWTPPRRGVVEAEPEPAQVAEVARHGCDMRDVYAAAAPGPSAGSNDDATRPSSQK